MIHSQTESLHKADSSYLHFIPSLTPTFAACAVFLNNARWDGVPFLLKAGKALESRMAEIRVQFRHVPGSLYQDKVDFNVDASTNELVGLAKG